MNASKWLLAAGLFVLQAAAWAGSSAFFAELHELTQQQVAVTALAVDVSTGEVVASLDPDQRLVPASLSKLYLAATALHYWGSDKTFSTRLYHDGRIDAGRLEGNLILAGGGDPALVSETLWSLIGQLQARGITQVSGDLVVDASLFGRRHCQTIDRCQARHASNDAYDAELSSAGINYGAWCIRVAPARQAGQAASVSTCPLALPAVAIDNQVKTVKQGRELQFSRVSGKQGDVIRVSGEIGVTQPAAHLYVSAGDASYQAGVILKQQLALAGIDVSGEVRVIYRQQAERQLLASMQSAPLATLVKKMLDYSNNYMADVLTLGLLAETHAARPLALDHAGRYLLQQARQFLKPLALRKGIQPAVLASGSGLSLKNRLSARDLTLLLRRTYASTAIFPAFVAALTVPKFSQLGILRGPEALWQTHVMVKSGSLNQPHTVYGIAGYVRTLEGRWLAFAILLNGTEKHSYLPYNSSMAVLRQAVVKLAHYQKQPAK